MQLRDGKKSEQADNSKDGVAEQNSAVLPAYPELDV